MEIFSNETIQTIVKKENFIIQSRISELKYSNGTHAINNSFPILNPIDNWF